MNKWLRTSAVVFACATAILLVSISLSNSGIRTAEATRELPSVSETTRTSPLEVLDGIVAGGDSTILLAGDSLAAGEGAGLYAPETRKPGYACHRSAAGILSQMVPAERLRIVGCSRATTADFHGTSHYPLPGSGEPRNQLASIVREQPDAVVLIVGANDIGFPQLLNDCLVRENFDCSGDAAVRQRTSAKFDGLQQKLERLYTDLLDASPAQIFIPAYPDLLSGSGTCGRINGSERQYGQSIISELNRHIAAAVRSVAKVHSDGYRLVSVTDTAPALDGHGPCSEDPWVNPYGVLSLVQASTSGTRAQEILHPTATGYAALTKVLAPYFQP